MVQESDIKKELAVRAGARDSLLLFTKYTMPSYEINWHHNVVAEVLQKFERGEIKNLMIFLPPQTGKTELATKRFAAWRLGRNPNCKIGIFAYNQTYASAFNRAIQRTIDSVEYRNVFPRTRLNGKNVASDAKGAYLRNSSEFEVVAFSGGLKTVGTGGALTGSPLDWGIIDDPIKDQAEAKSLTYRNALWDWYESVFLTRMQNSSQQLITLTRWHEDDLAGRILEREAKDWFVLTLPAINEYGKSEFDLRNIGEVLWSERHSLERMLKKQNDNPKTFRALYQQKPSADEGEIFKKEYFDIVNFDKIPAAAFSKTFATVDTAFTAKQANDPSGILYSAFYENTLYIIHYENVRLEFSELIEKLVQVHDDWGSSTSKMFIEPKANGLSVIQYLRKNTPLNVVEYKMLGGDKITRANLAEPFAQSKRVVILKGAWNHAFLDNLTAFPNALHDEEVDCLVMAVDIAEKLTRKNNKGQNNLRKSRNIAVA